MELTAKNWESSSLSSLWYMFCKREDSDTDVSVVAKRNCLEIKFKKSFTSALMASSIYLRDGETG